MHLFIFGNGNLSFRDFLKYYVPILDALDWEANPEFIVGEFRGADTLAMEYLKTQTAQVTVLHIGERPRYFPDKYKTKVSQWTVLGGFESDEERDEHAIQACTHFLAIDFNSNEKRTSGTRKNIDRLRDLGKIELKIL
jgi:hypothetical protein